MHQFSKPDEARQIEARARAKSKGVRVSVIERAKAYSTCSQTQPGVVYTVARTRTGWSCECDGYLYTGVCKHIAQVERRAEREGWTFGVIAAITRDEAPAQTRPDQALGLSILMAKRS